jgi:hypothetical protein
MKRWAVWIAVLLVAALISGGLYVNHMADEIMAVTCIDRPEALHLAFDMLLHRHQDFAVAARPDGPCP